MNFNSLVLVTSTSRLRRRALAAISLIAALVISPAFGQIPPLESPDQYRVPTDLSGVHFYLITVDVGDMVWDNFGHSALRVFDENSNTDTVFNWGGFDASG